MIRMPVAPSAQHCINGVSHSYVHINPYGSRTRAGDSCLLRHELAYILGQLGYTDSVEDLCAIVNDDEDDAIVRHEAAEALGAIGDERAKPILQAHLDDGAPEVRETCQLALDLFAWRAKDCTENVNAFRSVDPAPPADTSDSLDNLRQILLSSATSLWNRCASLACELNEKMVPAGTELCSGCVILARKLPFAFWPKLSPYPATNFTVISCVTSLRSSWVNWLTKLR